MAWTLFVMFLVFCGILIAVGFFIIGFMVGTANTAVEAARLAEYLGPGRRIVP